MSQFISVEVTNFIAVATIERPPVNALSVQLRNDLISAFDILADREDVRVIVLTGAGNAFCAGADVKERRDTTTPGAAAQHNRLARETYNAIRDCPKPVIAAVNGVALGAGMGIALSCDIVLASGNAKFGMPEVNVGIAGGASVLEGLLSRSAMRRMLMTGRHMDAAELYRLGAIEACVQHERLLPEAIVIAEDIVKKSPAIVRKIKEVCNVAELLPSKEVHRVEQNSNRDLAHSADVLEARLAFIERRAPVFTGQ